MRSVLLGITAVLLTVTRLGFGAESEPMTEPAPVQPAPGPAAPPPYSAWQGTEYGGPVAGPPVLAPPPSPGSPEYSRRPVELIPSLALALPNCRAGSASNQRCDGVTTGAGIGFTGLWRVTPYFAWGGGLELSGFRYDPPEAIGLTNTSAAAVWLGLIGRVYFNDEGSLDPYVQLGLGVGALGTTGTDTSGATWEETGAGPAGQLGGGLDFFLGRSIKLGPSIAYTRVFVDKIRRCQASGDGNCVDVSKDENGHLNGYFSVGAKLSILLGGEL
ncbi:MAG: hypothetical protein IPI67_34015 [Myxococcales bacterium]|nr:hypothetical protein [Myxococcales bacterium]